jgi:hypothetical protein
MYTIGGLVAVDEKMLGRRVYLCSAVDVDSCKRVAVYASVVRHCDE